MASFSWPVAAPELRWEKNTAGWLVAGAELMWEKSIVGCLAASQPNKADRRPVLGDGTAQLWERGLLLLQSWHEDCLFFFHIHEVYLKKKWTKLCEIFVKLLHYNMPSYLMIPLHQRLHAQVITTIVKKKENKLHVMWLCGVCFNCSY
jgi:hypothetical protein